MFSGGKVSSGNDGSGFPPQQNFTFTLFFTWWNQFFQDDNARFHYAQT